MNLDLALKNPLLLLEEHAALVKATVAQIEKDFLQNGLELRLSEAEIHTVTELRSKLDEVFAWLLERDEQRLLQLLYRIDLGEDKLQQAMRNNQEQSLHALLSDLVLRREAQKAVIRHLYKPSQS